MATRPIERRPRVLRDRTGECRALDRLLDALRQHDSAALVVRGEPGVGKTAVLEYAAESASDLRVVRAAGFESEMELAFAGLHQLCAPMLDRLERIPAPQRDALCCAFGLSAPSGPDRFLVGLAVLSLFSEVAEEQPLLCVIDDAQALDEASAQTLAFVARRLLAESVGVVFATCEASPELLGLPELHVRGLRNGQARQLLDSAIAGPLDAHVRDQIVAETRGNPLALLELATGERARQRTVETSEQLTAQEAVIARLARDGLSNAQIGARLFISPRTVEYHLHKVFAKLGIGSRIELDGVVPDDGDGELRRS